MLEIKNITKKYKHKTILNDLSCFFESKVNALVGLNGCGKSTLLKIIGGFISANDGQILLANNNISGFSPEYRNIGYVPQNACLFPNLTVYENISYSKKNNRADEKSINEAMELMEIAEYAKNYPYQLSGGYQSRTALARALAAKPQALLLDEPLSSLDLEIKERLIPKFKEVLQYLNIPVLYVSHDFSEAKKLGETFYLLHKQNIFPVDSLDMAFEYYKND